MSAWICAILGLLSSLWIGPRALGLSLGETLLCIVVSLASGLFALLATLKAERTPWLKRTLFAGGVRTWLIFLLFYIGPIVLFGPRMREGWNFLWLGFPLALCTGLTILIFGPIQDWIVAKFSATRDSTDLQKCRCGPVAVVV